MQANKKHCDGCGKQLPIWKNVVVDGIRNRLCKHCWSCHKSNDSNKPTKNSKPIAPRSHKRSQEERVYTGKRVIFMLEHPMCQANITGLCTHRSTDVHHKYSGSNRSEYFLDETTWLSVCRSCHKWIHENSKVAREIGLLK